MVKNRWDAAQAAQVCSGLDELVYRSNLLGADRSVANWGGGNTSMKMEETDFRGRPIQALWVKGSGSDLATMKAQHFAGLNLDDVQPLMKRDKMSDEDMVGYLSHCLLDPKHPRPSIETLLHAFLPFKHVDHTHPDAIISICCADNGRQIAEEVYGNRFVWVPYIRPGFSLSKMIAEGVQQNPHAQLVLMEKHGLVTWGDTSEESYNNTISVIQEAESYIEARVNTGKLFGGAQFEALPEAERRDILTQVMPVIRGVAGGSDHTILTYDDSDDVLGFVNSQDAPSLSQVGAACPDHLVHTKRVPLYVQWDPKSGDVAALEAALRDGINTFKQEYRKYFERNQDQPGIGMADPAPRVILIPGIGMVNTGRSHTLAKLSGDLYHRAISVMRGATTLGNFVSLNEKESYDVEYWPLELYKLTLLPPPAEFSRQIGFVTGGAGGIGSATCRALAAEGIHVVIADINLEKAQQVAQELNQAYGAGRAIAVKVDVTNEQTVVNAFKDTILAYGGIDVLVNNAGLATSNPLDKTSLDEWNLNMNVLNTGYFLVAREAFKLMKQQGTGGSMVFVGSKNSIYAGKNAAAYSAAKAAEVHLARCIATEGGEYGIRVNSVLPDAVLQGSNIWNSSWREQRAAAYGIEPDQLEDYYRKRTTLLVNVLPEDIANAIAFLSSSKAAKTTGCMVTVDGGVAAAFTR